MEKNIQEKYKIKKANIIDLIKLRERWKYLKKEKKKDFNPNYFSNNLVFIFLCLCSIINKNIYNFILAKEKNNILGFSYCHNNACGIMVFEGYRKKGIGLKLMNYHILNQTYMGLSVFKYNNDAIKLYEKVGFKKIRELIVMEYKR